MPATRFLKSINISWYFYIWKGCVLFSRLHFSFLELTGIFYSISCSIVLVELGQPRGFKSLRPVVQNIRVLFCLIFKKYWFIKTWNAYTIYYTVNSYANIFLFNTLAFSKRGKQLLKSTWLLTQGAHEALAKFFVVCLSDARNVAVLKELKNLVDTW